MYLGPGRARHKEAVHRGLAWVLAGLLLVGIKRELGRVFTKGGNGWTRTQLHQERLPWQTALARREAEAHGRLHSLAAWEPEVHFRDCAVL